MSEIETTKNNSAFSTAWATVLSAFALVVLLGNVVDTLPKMVLPEKQMWITHFFLDLLVLLLTIAIAPLVLRAIDVPKSLRALRDRSQSERTVLALGVFAAVVLFGVLALSGARFYEVRYQYALIDWHAVYAFDAMAHGDYTKALKELKEVAPSTVTREARERLAAEIDRRLKDAETLLTRSHSLRKSGRSSTFAEILMIGRAARLAPRAPHVQAAVVTCRQILSTAAENYLEGVEHLRQHDYKQAVTNLRASKQACSGLLHQDLLLRYANNQSPSLYTPEERALVAYYLRTPLQKLKADFLAWPPLLAFAPIGLSTR